MSKAYITYSNGNVDTCDFGSYDCDEEFINFYNTEDKLVAMYKLSTVRGIRFHGV